MVNGVPVVVAPEEIDASNSGWLPPAGQDWMKASRSALIVGAWVVGMPWGNPW
jgi:hypothetical protein